MRAASRRASLLVPLRFLLVRAYSSIRVQLIWRKVGSGTRRSFAWQGRRHGGAGGSRRRCVPFFPSLMEGPRSREQEPGGSAERLALPVSRASPPARPLPAGPTPGVTEVLRSLP